MSISEQVNSQIRILRRLSFECHCQWKEELEFALSEAADTIESLSEKLEDMERSVEDCGSRWISCKDRLPETRNNILVCQSDGYVSVGYYSWDRAFLDLNSIPFDDVIAWRKLPEPYHEP